MPKWQVKRKLFGLIANLVKSANGFFKCSWTREKWTLTWQRTARNRKWREKSSNLRFLAIFATRSGDSVWLSDYEQDKELRKIVIFVATCEPGHKWDSNPWPLWYRWKSAALVSQRSRIRIPYKPEFFSDFLFATAKVADITAMIISSFNSSLRSSQIRFSYIHNFKNKSAKTILLVVLK